MKTQPIVRKNPWFLSSRLAAGLALVALTGCETTSLSNPRGRADELPMGGLAGATGGAATSERDIAAALRQSGREGSVRLLRGQQVFLVQSGAAIPDPELRMAVERFATVVPGDGRANSYGWSGSRGKDDVASGDELARRIRLAAAKAGCQKAMIVFGEFQTLRKDLPTVAVSWVPVAGWIIPDEYSGTRLLLQAMLVDTASGALSVVSGPPVEMEGFSNQLGRPGKVSRRSLVMKEKSYPELVRAAYSR